jgi:hypothetical protein
MIMSSGSFSDGRKKVRGCDLSPVQPTWVAPNVKFEVADVESPWTYRLPFDFVFCRSMVSCIADWPGLIDEIFQSVSFVLNPRPTGMSLLSATHADYPT